MPRASARTHVSTAAITAAVIVRRGRAVRPAVVPVAHVVSIASVAILMDKNKINKKILKRNPWQTCPVIIVSGGSVAFPRISGAKISRIAFVSAVISAFESAVATVRLLRPVRVAVSFSLLWRRRRSSVVFVVVAAARGRDGRLPLVFLRLSFLVMAEIVENGRGVSVRVQDLEHLQFYNSLRKSIENRWKKGTNLTALVDGDLLGVARVGHRLVLVVLQSNVAQGRVGHVLDVDPLDGKLAAPLVLRPDRQRRRHVHRRRLLK